MKKSIPEIAALALLAGCLLLDARECPAGPDDMLQAPPDTTGVKTFFATGVWVERPKPTSTLTVVSRAILRFFERFISPVDNRQCIFHPTCSEYSRQALARHGFAGYPLSTARLIRCNSTAFSKGNYPRAKLNEDRYRAYDPVP